MATLSINEFSAYELTDEEMIQGSILTVTQKQVIQNQLSIAAAKKNSLEPNSADITNFLQQESHLRGVIDTYKYILDMSEASEDIAGNPVQ